MGAGETRRIGRRRALHALARGAAALGAAIAIPGGAARARTVEVELILAVDVSASVDPYEFDLQMRGYAEAFRSPDFLEALKGLGGDGLAVTMVQWADVNQQGVCVEWMHVHDKRTADAFARAVDGTGRLFEQGQTAIGQALEFCLRLFPARGYQGRKRVIDVSGDGYSNKGTLPNGVRDRAARQGITINGLAIINEERYLAGYYQRNVIGGPGAFVAVANDFNDFAQAILAKLLREMKGSHVAHGPVPMLPPA